MALTFRSASADVIHHIDHNVMLIPLCLAIGAVAAGVIFHNYFFGYYYDAFGRVLYTAADNNVLDIFMMFRNG